MNQTDLNQTELKIIEVVDKYVIYMLSKHDGLVEIYPKLLELEGQILEDWINDTLVEWLGNGVDYKNTYCNKCECEEDCECHTTKTEIVIHSLPIYDFIQTILRYEHEGIFYDRIITFNDSIFSNCRELIQIQSKITDSFLGERAEMVEDFETYYSLCGIVEKYCYMYLREMEGDLKQYIIDLIEPTLIEPK
jgi:hypothetical protein